MFFSCFSIEAKAVEKTYDIILLTIPKSGTHLIGKALKLMTGKDTLHLSFEKGVIADFETGQFPLNRFEQAMRKVKKGNKIALSHTYIVPIMSAYTQKHPEWAKILMIRDLRDVLVSSIFWNRTKKMLDQNLGRNSSIKERIKYLLITQKGRTFLSAIRAFEWSEQDPELLIGCFEDLVGPKGGGSLDKQKEALLTLSSHIGMDLTYKKLHYIIDHLFGSTPTFRSGQIGSWKKYFDEEITELFKESPLGKLLIKFGYEDDDNW